ncbi:MULTISPECIES: hypothetical protein [Streptomyces]|nr:hypothetical protein [Streptomyces sp. NEAU-383]
MPTSTEPQAATLAEYPKSAASWTIPSTGSACRSHQMTYRRIC